MIRPAAWFTDHATFPLFEDNGVRESGRRSYALEEPSGKQGVGRRQQARNAFGAVESVCPRTSRDDSSTAGRGVEEERGERRVWIEISSCECP